MYSTSTLSELILNYMYKMSHFIIKTVGLLPMAAKTEATQLREKERERQTEREGGES